jgi:murein DD-endopeptidase MepM/ murein hydrolase activator NlpD
MIKRETARQYAYEDRIAALKAEIDKLSSRQLVDQDGVEARVAELVTRQSQLETRQAIVAALADSVSSQQLISGRQARASAPQTPLASTPAGPSVSTTSSISSFAPSSRPMPVPEMPGLRRDGETRQPQAANAWEQSALEAPLPIDARLGKVERSLGQVSAAQIKALSRIEASVTSAHQTLRSVVVDVGLDADRLAASPRGSAVGGPLVPANIDAKAGPFEASVIRLQPRLQAVEKLRQVVGALPVRRPIAADAEQTSPFGHRVDPFTRGLAMHTGLDFRAETGSPVVTAGAGRVVTAEYNGGYGNMVEVDHGHGLTTRYAHLSQILVSEGQQVGAGALVGRVGSTGRSTGPHLHYETRMDGEAVDPQRFLKAGQRFFARN